jgi:hypothetical protein
MSGLPQLAPSMMKTNDLPKHDFSKNIFEVRLASALKGQISAIRLRELAQI